MKFFIIPLLFLAIVADVYCMWQWENISDSLYYKGETIVYLLWVLAFWIYVKWTPIGLSRKAITLILISWLPFCVNAIYRQFSGLGHQRSVIDLYSGFISLALIIIQVIWWWYKNKKQE